MSLAVSVCREHAFLRLCLGTLFEPAEVAAAAAGREDTDASGTLLWHRGDSPLAEHCPGGVSFLPDQGGKIRAKPRVAPEPRRGLLSHAGQRDGRGENLLLGTFKFLETPEPWLMNSTAFHSQRLFPACPPLACPPYTDTGRGPAAGLLVCGDPAPGTAGPNLAAAQLRVHPHPPLSRPQGGGLNHDL